MSAQAEDSLGDDAREISFSPNAPFQTSWDIEIDRSASKVWPWLVQMGYQRAGWYIGAWWDEAINEHFWPKIVSEERSFSWAFILDPLAEDRCRLTIRTRATMTPKLVAGVFVPVLKVIDRLFVKQMLRGIKRRVEANGP